jgi:gentisate 1,2-dioxygenase
VRVALATERTQQKKDQLLDMELITINPKVVVANLINMVRRAIQGIFLEVTAIRNKKAVNQNHIHMENLMVIRNPRAVNQNHIHMENPVTGRVLMPTRVAMENLMVIRNPRAVNQNHIHMENPVTGKVLMPIRVAMENLMVTKKVHTEVMATVLLNTLCIININWV